MSIYYPESRIVKYNTPKNNLIDNYGNPYKGPYYVTFDGSYFSGDGPNDMSSKPLFINHDVPNTNSIDSNQNIIFDKLNPNLNVSNLDDVPSYVIDKNKLDYNKKNIIRYFAKERKPRNFIIKEINQDSYNDIVNREGKYNYSKWDVISLMWVISSGKLSKDFVYNQNQRIVNQKNKHMIGLNVYLNDYTQFSIF